MGLKDRHGVGFDAANQSGRSVAPQRDALRVLGVACLSGLQGVRELRLPSNRRQDTIRVREFYAPSVYLNQLLPEVTTYSEK